MARKKKKRIIGLPIIISLVFVLIAMIGIIAYWYINGNKIRLPGEWYRQIDLTSQVKEGIEDYLNSATFGEEIEVDKYIDVVLVESHLSITDDGKLVEVIDDQSYADAKAKANDALKQAVSDLIQFRVEKNYIETDKTPEELVDETFGMDLSKYLSQYGPQLMPKYDELNAVYGVDATYEAERETIEIFSDETVSCEYAVAGQMLVIDYPDKAAIYHSKKAEKEGADNE